MRRRHRRERRDAEGEVWVRSGISRVWARYAGQRKRVRRSGTEVGAWVVEQIGWFNSLCLSKDFPNGMRRWPENEAEIDEAARLLWHPVWERAEVTG